MDVPTKMKADVKKGQAFKAGGAVKKDTALQEWHRNLTKRKKGDLAHAKR
jgi:hypothetical protein